MARCQVNYQIFHVMQSLSWNIMLAAVLNPGLDPAQCLLASSCSILCDAIWPQLVYQSMKNNHLQQVNFHILDLISHSLHIDLQGLQHSWRAPPEPPFLHQQLM